MSNTIIAFAFRIVSMPHNEIERLVQMEVYSMAGSPSVACLMYNRSSPPMPAQERVESPFRLALICQRPCTCQFMINDVCIRTTYLRLVGSVPHQGGNQAQVDEREARSSTVEAEVLVTSRSHS